MWFVTSGSFNANICLPYAYVSVKLDAGDTDVEGQLPTELGMLSMLGKLASRDPENATTP